MNVLNKSIVSILVVLFCYSCKKFVQINPPTTELVTSSVFSTPSSAISTETVIYAQMWNNLESYEMSSQNGLLADEFTNYSTSALQIDMYENAMTAALGPSGCWIDAYNYIYEANAILAGMQGNKFTPSIANQILGEANFIRAFWYFYLVNEYGDVPLVTTTQYQVNSLLSRTPKAQVYRQIVTDLTAAENLLNANYIDATDTVVTTERVRPNKSVAAALLARVYLYMGIYDSAETQATQVINNVAYSLIKPLTSTNYAFTKNNTEAIWQLSTPLPTSFNGATPEGFEYILTSAPSNVALSQSLVNSFEPGDQRKAFWVGTYTTTSGTKTTYYFSYKYKVSLLNGSPTNITEYTMVLRLAEQYLIRSEARAQQNNLSGAVADLNTIRNRAGLPNIADSIASSQSSMLNAILHERQVELFTEWGHRWFDLIRMGAVDSVMGNPVNACKSKNGTWDDHSKLYPIQSTELGNDPNLVQNPGY